MITAVARSARNPAVGCTGAVCQFSARLVPVTELSGVWAGVERDVVAVVGADARTYLHGQVSQDVQSLAIGESRWTLVLAPNGRVEVLARVLCAADGSLRARHRGRIRRRPVSDRLNRFRIRVKADLEQSTLLYANCEPARAEIASTAHSSRIGWWNTGQWFDDLPSGASSAGTIDDYERARVAAGWPAMGTEIVPGERIPAEIAVAPVAVNFTKGCYPGQELVERMDSRGPRRRASCASSPHRGRRAWRSRDRPRRPGGSPAGEITSVAGDKALAYVKRGAAVGDVPGPASAEQPGGCARWRTPGC